MCGGGPSSRPRTTEKRKPEYDETLQLVLQARSQFQKGSVKYNQFMDIMVSFESRTIDRVEWFRRLFPLLRDKSELIRGFSSYLPRGYKIDIRRDPETGADVSGLMDPEGLFTIIPSEPYTASKPATPAPSTLDVPSQDLPPQVVPYPRPSHTNTAGPANPTMNHDSAAATIGAPSLATSEANEPAAQDIDTSFADRSAEMLEHDPLSSDLDTGVAKTPDSTLRGTEPHRAASTGNESSTIPDTIQKPRFDIEYQRHWLALRQEMDALIRTAQSAVEKLEKNEPLTGDDCYPLDLMYGDKFGEIESHLSSENNANAVHTVLKRLKERLQGWTTVKEELEDIWHSSRQKYTRAEFLVELQEQKVIEAVVYTATTERGFVDDLVWFICESKLDTVAEAARTATLVDSAFTLLIDDNAKGEAVLDPHAYSLLRLLAHFTNTARIAAKRDKLEATLTAVKSLLEIGTGSVEYEKWAKDTFGDDDWTHIADLPAVAKRFATAAMKLPLRKHSYEHWKAATARGEGSIVPTSDVTADNLVRTCWKKNGDEGQVKVEWRMGRKRARDVSSSDAPTEPKSKFVRYIERLVAKRQKQLAAM